MRDDFAVLILSYGRPDNIRTLRSLEISGYTGRTYIVVSDDDPTLDEYRERFGDQVRVFNKDEVEREFDTFDNFSDQRGVVWARNAAWSVAREIGVSSFIQLDDDYTSFLYRRAGEREGLLGYHGWTIRSLDAVLEAMIEFVESTPALTLCMSQGGDHMGGGDSVNAERIRLRRKAMNSFVCLTDRPFKFRGRINEDVNTYVRLGGLGELLFTYMPLQLNQLLTQSSSGGMTGTYEDNGTYVKSFYTVLTAPSCVKISGFGRTDMRLHHRVDWRHAVPKILHEKHRR